MFRRLVVLLLIVSIFLAFGVTAYAGSADGESPEATTPEGNAASEAQAAFDKMLADVIKDSEAVNTDKFLVTFTKPESEKAAAYEKSYLFAGMAKESDVRICLAKYNEETKVYEALTNLDGDSYWDVAKGTAFAKEIPLSKGENKIKIVVYSTTDTSTVKQEDVQISSFTISSLDKNLVTIVKDTINSIKAGITDIFKRP